MTSDQRLLDETGKLLDKLVAQAREVCAAWHDASRLDGADRFARALEDLEALVGRDQRR
jgi:hypothetical protein